MGTCVPTQALLAGLVRRIREEDAVPARRDLESLLTLGLTEIEIAAAFAEIGGTSGANALAALEAVTRGRAVGGV